MAKVSLQFILLYALFGKISSQGWSTGDSFNRNYGQNDPYSNNAFGAGGNSLEPFRVMFEWKQLDYNWIDEMTRSQSLTNRRYIPENNALAGIKAWRDRIFVTIPRWKEGVPVTLASVPSQTMQNNISPRLEAFPNWQMQEIGNCSAFQFVQSMEIDTEGRMWIIDSGRTNIMSGGGHDSRCPPKLVIIDLNSVQFPFFNQLGPNFGSQNFGPQQFGQNPNYPNYQGNSYGNNPGGQYGPNQYNNPNQPYNPNHPYNPNNPNQPYNSNQPYNPNHPYNSNPPYNSNQPYNPNNPNQPYNPNNPNQPYNPNSPNQSYNPNSPNQYNRNNPPPYNPSYPNPSNSNYPNTGQYGSSGTNYPQGFNNYPNFNSSNPQYDQFGNYIGNQQGRYQGQYPNQGIPGSYNPAFPNTFSNNNFRIVKTFNFPSNVASQYGSYLNDIVLDNANGWYAYITDHGDDPGIIVYSFRDDRSWKVKDATSMRSDPDSNFVNINSIDIELRGKNLDGIALSPASGYERTLYYCPLGSYNLYSVPTSVLKNPSLSSDVSSSVRDLGRKQSITDGMIMDNRGNLYYGLLGFNAIGVWDSNRGTRIDDGSRIIARDNTALQWPDSFSIDESGNLYVVTNRLQNYITGRVNLNEPNYRILRAPLGVRSYLQPADTSRSGGIDGRSNGFDNYWGSGYNSYYYNSAGTAAANLLLLLSFSFFLVVR